MAVREATEKDLPSICRLSDEINMEHVAKMPRDFIEPDGSDRDTPYWRGFMEAEGAAVFVAEEGGAVVGVIAVSVSASVPYPFLVSRPRAHVATVVVANPWRGRGMGRELMSVAEAFAKNQGADDIRLEVMAFNGAAVRFYEELGYQNLSFRMCKPLP